VRGAEDEDFLLAEAETLVAEATGRAEPPPFRPRMEARKPAGRQGDLFARRATRR
jgi:hypothetical protein